MENESSLTEIFILFAVLFSWILSALIGMRLRTIENRLDEIQTKLDVIQTKLDGIKRATRIQDIPLAPSISFPWKVTCGGKNENSMQAR